MFNVPDWETDVPKKNAVFTKRATNVKYKTESVEANPSHDFVKYSQDPKRNITKSNTKPIISIGTASSKKKKTKKRKLNNDSEDIFKKEAEGFEFDELLVNAKKHKLNEVYMKDDCEELLFSEDKTTISPDLKKLKKNKQKFKLKLPDGKNDVVITSQGKQKQSGNENEINRVTIKAKKSKHNDTDTVENGPPKANDKKKHSKIQKINKAVVKENKDINGNEKKNKLNNVKIHNITTADMAVSEVKHINNDFKKKEKFKKLLQQTHRTTINVTGNKLRERMLDRLKAAQFRYLNEKLYTSSGNEAQQIFQTDPTAFTTYHQGYQLQVKKWPVNPLDVIVAKIQKMPKTYVVADMGCGEAALSTRVPNKVHSFDLVASAPGVVACDMARTPLLRESTDVVVYCLALMGTELTQYLVEANRVLKTGGQLLIAEVESRFDDVNSFVKEVERLGFKLKNLDKQHSVFFFMHFTKVKEPPVKKGKLPVLSLKPCLYKKR